MSEQSCGRVLSYGLDDGALLLAHELGLSRIDGVAPDILRIRWTPQARFPPRRSWDVLEDLPCLRIRESAIQETTGHLEFGVGSCRITVPLSDGRLSFLGPEGQRFGEDLVAPATGPLQLGGTVLDGSTGELPPGVEGLFLRKHLSPDENCFGLGERTGEMNQRRRRLSNWTADSPGYHSRGHDNLYQASPFLLMLRPDFAWGLYLHTSWYSAFDVGYQEEQTLHISTLGNVLDYFLLSGPTPAAVVEQLTRLTGRPALPPLWALGYQQSRWSYRSFAEVETLVAEFRHRRLPLDVVYLDIDHMDGYRVFTWDPQRFPHPSQSLHRLHAQSVRAVAIVDPGVKLEAPEQNPLLREGLERDLFIHRANGELFTGYVWPGKCVFPDFSRAEVRAWWAKHQASLLAAGVDGIWCDMNEPSILDRPLMTRGQRHLEIPLDSPQGEASEQTCHAELHNLYGLLMVQASYQGQRKCRPAQRPWVLTRSAFTGAQRYAASWTGDNHSSWEHLALSLPQLANLGLSGMPCMGVDIGGFYGHCHGELFARWIELGTFYPVMRNHCAYDARAQEPWAFGPAVEAVAKQAIERRYRLLPYLNTLTHQAHKSGAPLLRPLFYDFPRERDLHQIEDQMMVGPLLMVAPVLRPGIQRRLVELPPGTWYDFHSGALVGPGPLVQSAPMGRIPLFVKGGAILTLGNSRQSTAEPLTQLTLDVYPGAAGAWTHVDDDGESFDYLSDGLGETDVTLAEQGDALVLQIGARRGGFIPSPRRLRVQLHLPDRQVDVRLDGRAVPADWEAALNALVLSWPDDGRAHCVAVIGPTSAKNESAIDPS